jgi:hypothetical protein
MTMVAASVSSVLSAVVVSHIWGPGTLYGAAATPIIVALVSEALQRPKRVIETARQVRATRGFDPVAEGRRGLHEGDFATVTPLAGTDRSVHRVPTGPRVPRVSRRRRVAIAVATGVLAFAVAAFALTGGELVFGSSAVGGVASRTTLFGGASSSQQQKSKSTSKSSSQQKTESQPSGSTTTKTQTSTTTSTPTTTTPAPSSTSPSTSTGSGQGVAPPSTTGGSSTTPPTTNSPSPSTNQPPSKSTPAPPPAAP